MCILLSVKQLTADYNKIKKFAQALNISIKNPNLYSKLQGMMLGKCNKSLPLNLNEKDEKQVKKNIKHYIGLNYTELSQNHIKFSLVKTKEEEAIELDADDIVSIVQKEKPLEKIKKKEADEKLIKEKIQSENPKRKKKLPSLKRKFNDFVLENLGIFILALIISISVYAGCISSINNFNRPFLP